MEHGASTAAAAAAATAEDEHGDVAGRRHRGAGKAMTWDQFSFDKILPSIQAEFNEQGNVAVGAGPAAKEESRMTWFTDDFAVPSGSTPPEVGGHKRSATIAAPGMSDGFDFSTLTASLSETLLSGDASGDAQGRPDADAGRSSFFAERGAGAERKQDLETIDEAGFRSPPRHRRSQTHAASNFPSMVSAAMHDPMPESSFTASTIDNSSFGSWGGSLGANASPNIARTKSERQVDVLDMTALREQVDSWKYYPEGGANGSRPDNLSPASATSKTSSVPGERSTPVSGNSPRASSAAGGAAGSAASSPRDMRQQQQQQQQQQYQQQEWAQQQQQQQQPSPLRPPQHQQQHPGLVAPPGHWEGNEMGVPPQMPHDMYGYMSATQHMMHMGMPYGGGAEMGSTPDPMMMQQWMQHYSNMYYPPAGYAGQMPPPPKPQMHHPHHPQYYAHQQQGQMSPPPHAMHSPPSGGSGASGNGMGHFSDRRKSGGGDRGGDRGDRNNNNNSNNNNNGGSGGGGKQGGKSLCPALVEYRSSGRRPAMSELVGHVVEFSRDAHGSRFIQFKMETASEEEKQILVDEVAEDAIGLMQDTFGNYVLQNFLEHASEDQRYTLGRTMAGSMIQLSSQAHGCRVVQRAILLLPKPLRNSLLAELLMTPADTSQCARNSHATHVMQKVVSLIVEEEAALAASGAPAETFDDAPSTSELLRAVERAVELDFVPMGVHPHAYRLVLTVMDNCDPSRSKAMGSILDEILPANMHRLAKDQHGNFVLQHILNRGNVAQKEMVQQFVADHVVELAQHKFGSHLVEKCLACANPQQVECLVQQIICPTALNSEQSKLMASNASSKARGPAKGGRKSIENGDDTLLLLMSDPYANFVVQRAFDASQGQLRQRLVEEIKSRSEVLSKFTYGRHILLHINRQAGEGGRSGSDRRGSRGGARRKK